MNVAGFVVLGGIVATPVPPASGVGELTYDECLADDASDGCVDLPETPLTGAHGETRTQAAWAEPRARARGS
jgi:hypothetical protein